MGFIRFATAAVAATGVAGVYCFSYLKHGETSSNRISHWDDDWDRLKPTPESLEDKNGDKKNKKMPVERSNVERNIFLIRHGQYNIGKEPKNLTKLGQQQALVCAHRLKDLNIPFSSLTSSSLTRAVETAKLINDVLKLTCSVREDPLLNEGSPVKPEPCNKETSSLLKYHEDGPRIEAAFRRYIHRAHADQLTDSYELVICHANVIRYFVCRALQLPPEAWLRMSVPHCSVTWLVIRPNGRVTLRCLGDSGFIPPSMVTY